VNLPVFGSQRRSWFTVLFFDYLDGEVEIRNLGFVKLWPIRSG
jgi:hypothetical protein